MLEILAFNPEGKATRLSEGIGFAEKVLRQRTTVFIVSDFLTSTTADPQLPHAMRKLAWDHDVVPIRLSDPATSELPNVGMLAVTDPETGRRQVVNTSRTKVRDAHRERGAHARAVVDGIFRDLQLDVVDIDTTEEYLPPLIGFFRARARALR